MLVVIKESIDFGLTGVRSHSGLTGGDAKRLQEASEEKQFSNILGDKAKDAIVYAMAVAEANAAMGRIVAAPTAGASGVLPGVFFALKKHYGLSDQVLAEGLVVAGGIGLVIADRASLAGATGGCQAECGSAAAMAAGAAVAMLGGTPTQVGHAVAIVFKNILGLVCDPVAGLVEVPCIKRNGSCALQALAAAELALAGIGSFIPADETIDAMKSVGDSLPCALKETAGGGMATTPTALAWAKKYFAK
jgi:L-serine dehydratase